jgi:hypothetical protein
LDDKVVPPRYQDEGRDIIELSGAVTIRVALLRVVERIERPRIRGAAGGAALVLYELPSQMTTSW